MADRYPCVHCRKDVAATKNNRYRSHATGDGEPCKTSSEEIPEHVLTNGPVDGKTPADVPVAGVDYAVCPQCDRKVKLTRLGYFEPHDQTLRGGDRCPNSGVRVAKKVVDVELPASTELVAATRPAEAAATASEAAPKREPAKSNLERQPMESAPSADSSASTETSSPESTTTSSDSQQWTEVSDSFFLETVHVILMDAAGWPEESAPAATQGPDFDGMLFAKAPSRYPPKSNKPMRKMTERELEVAGRVREIFYAYTSRDSSDNRSAQRTLGPSEAGSPCDRQIAMKLLNIEPVNPQEGWAAFVGTAVHEELARMFEWANGSGSGRFVTEMPVTLGNVHVPRGTLDLLDRVLYVVADHKLMGRWSLEQLRKEGPSEVYRKQIQIYGLGAELAGEEVREVAIIGWPRQESSLNKLFVHIEPYDRRVAEEALDRVARVAQEIESRTGPGTPREPMSVAQSFSVEDACLWCPFHLKGDKEMKRGCPGV